jgi:hypothetical protein
MAEEKVGLIPKVVVQDSWGPKEYGILLTNERSIFVLESDSKTGAGYLLGGVVGAAIAAKMSDRKSVDYENTDIETMVRSEKSIAIPHYAIKRLRLKKGLGTYTLLLEYATAGGKKRKLNASVVPPPEYVKKRKDMGIKQKVAVREYVEKVRDAYSRALPFGIQQKAEWAI